MLSTAQQVWLRKLGGAKPVVAENASGIISAGRAKRSGSQPERTGERWVFDSIISIAILFNALQTITRIIPETDSSSLKRKRRNKNLVLCPQMLSRFRTQLILSLKMTQTMILNQRYILAHYSHEINSQGPSWYDGMECDSYFHSIHF